MILCFRLAMSRTFVRYTIFLTKSHVGVHKVPLQFQKFITKETDEISSSDLFRYVFITLHVPCKMATPQEKAQCVSRFIETKSNQRNLRTKYIEEIHRHVHQFVDGTKNLWRQEHIYSSIKEGVDVQEHLRKISVV